MIFLLHVEDPLRNAVFKLGGGGTPLIPTLGKQKQADLCEFEVSLDYRVSYRTVITQRNPVSRNKKECSH